MTGLQDSVAGATVCRYGRATPQRCGKIDSYVYRSVRSDGATKGYFYRIINPGTSPMNAGGDSGGPVYAGGSAAGLVHGVDNTGSTFFMPIWAMEGLPIGVMVCPNC